MMNDAINATITFLMYMPRYYYHGTLTVEMSVSGEVNLAVGWHDITTIISDDELSITCTSVVEVIGKRY